MLPKQTKEVEVIGLQLHRSEPLLQLMSEKLLLPDSMLNIVRKSIVYFKKQPRLNHG